ncbi:hypothetical protein NQD34_016525 [Periophthalmus magnuspinnatus]|nr:hypothetical protein NQD34_016525 [Periophthalmus magnuspinnatus]
MFGNLFEEDDEEGSSSISSKGRVLKGPEEPPPPRGRSNLCGIKNQGGTCYLNSLLQTLLFTPEFRGELFSLGPEELGCLEDKDTPGAKVRVIPLQLQRLFARLLLVDQQSASTAELTGSFGWNTTEGTNQHDVQELNRILFSALEHSLVGTSGSSFINRLYHGTIVNSIVCKECGNVSQRQEDFLDLTACVCGVSSLEEALWNMFVEEEVFEGNNLYRCAQCNKLVTAAKSAKMRKLPPFMTMSLLRFSFDFAKCERYKETGRYSFPLSINLRPFCELREGEDSDYSYELFSVIIHKGGCYGGHYHVYIKDIDQLGRWEPPEDDSKPKTKKKTTDGKVYAPKPQEDDPLSILTAIIGQEPSKTVLVDQLGQKLMDKFGFSWNKKFKKQYGAIGKFLQSHSDVFMLVSNGSRVALKVNPPSPMTEPTGPEQCTDSGGSHWFDLNDSTVTSIREADIEKQFQGKESAYMLFYRKTQLLRPPQALNNPQYKVPSQLIKMAEEENAKLQQTREEFEATNNTIELHLHLAPLYKLENGALQLICKEQEGTTTLSFDRRKTVGDLRLTIYQMQDPWDGDMALTVAKSLPAGLHLYNTLTDDGVSLYSAGITNNTDLFVWNGKEASVCGAAVLTGAEWEPVLLTVVRPFLGLDSEINMEDTGDEDHPLCEGQAPGLRREARGFAGAATLGEVKAALGEPKDSVLCQEARGRVERGTGEGGGASGWRVFPPDDMQRTLKELSLKDGDALLVLEPQSFDSSVFTLNGNVVTVTTPSDCRWLEVEHQPNIRHGEKEEEPNKVKVLATGNTYCLRQVDCTGKLLPPVCEELSVREAGVRLMTTLMLCCGRAPKASQLFLNFSVGVAPSAGLEMDIIVEKTFTVKEEFFLSLTLLIIGTGWHLRRLDWCEEVGEPLMDEDAPLPDLKINNGETLIITEGQLPPKVQFHSRFLIFMTSKHRYFLLCFPPLLVTHNASVIIALSVQVLTLPALSDLCVPTCAFLRLWQLEGRRLGRVLRGPQLTLRKLKLNSGTNICIQQLFKEEDLGPKEVVLSVKMGVPGEGRYYPTEELLWDASKDPSPRSLRSCLASHYGLSPDSLLLAKFQPDKHNWEEISSWNQQVSKKKKKKRTESLLGGPFHLTDGDTVGVKNLLIDNNRDFCTTEDRLCQQRLREQAQMNTGDQATGFNCVEQKKKGRQAKVRKPEVGLSISVGEFR